MHIDENLFLISLFHNSVPLLISNSMQKDMFLNSETSVTKTLHIPIATNMILPFVTTDTLITHYLSIKVTIHGLIRIYVIVLKFSNREKLDSFPNKC
jgi:hypothetical protein